MQLSRGFPLMFQVLPCDPDTATQETTINKDLIAHCVTELREGHFAVNVYCSGTLSSASVYCSRMDGDAGEEMSVTWLYSMIGKDANHPRRRNSLCANYRRWCFSSSPAGSPPTKASAGTLTTSPTTPSTSPGWRRSRAPAP